MQDLRQAHYHPSLIILLKEFIKLIVNTNMIINNVKHVALNIKIVSAFLDMETLKIIQKNINVCDVIIITPKKSLMKTLRGDLLIHTNFLKMTLISLIYSC